MRKAHKDQRIRSLTRKLKWRLGSLAVAGSALALLLTGVAATAAPASAAVARPSATTATHVRKRQHTLPRGVPRRLVRVHDIVVIRRATSTRPAALGRVTGVSVRHHRVVVTYVKVPSDALRPFHKSVHATGARGYVVMGPSTAGPGAVVGPAVSSSNFTLSCSGFSAGVGFQPSASGSIGVTWIDVWAGIIWSPEISGSIGLDPNISVTLAGLGFKGSCSHDFGIPQKELATVGTPAGPLSLCFGLEEAVGASVSVTLSRSVTLGLSGQVGTDYHFGFTGAGLNPFDTVGPYVSYSGGPSWSGSLYATTGPYLDAEWGVCGVAGVGVSAGLYDTLSWNAYPSGWNITSRKYVNASVNLNLLGWSYSDSLYNWGLENQQLVSGGW